MSMTPPIIDFVGIGVPKAGTTWLSRCLEEHPNVCFSKPKETYFFCSKNITSKDPVPYHQAFIHCKDTKIKGEFTPIYIYEAEAAEAIKELNPDVKILISLREPVSQLLSKYRHLYLKDPQNEQEFIQTITTDKRLLDQTRYEKYLEVWLRLFKREQILFIDYEDIKNDSAITIKRLYTFLDIQSDFIPNFINIKINTRAERTSRAASYLILLKNKYLKIFGHKKPFHNRLKKMYFKTITFLYSRNKYEIGKETRKYLYDRYFSQTAQEVKNMTGLTLTSWKE